MYISKFIYWYMYNGDVFIFLQKNIIPTFIFSRSRLVLENTTNDSSYTRARRSIFIQKFIAVLFQKCQNIF